VAIPEANLDTWSSIGAIQTSAMTYASVRSALLAAGTGYEGKVDVYLQGSYANHTNIRKESDVDVVVQLTSAFHYDLDALPPDQKDAFRTTYPTNANYAGAQYKADVLAALRDAFGGDAQPGSKAISIAGNPNRRKASTKRREIGTSRWFASSRTFASDFMRTTSSRPVLLLPTSSRVCSTT